MTLSNTVVYFSSQLLEKNRWNGKGPSFIVSDWMGYIGEAGYAGVDLGMNQLKLSSRSEWELIKEKAEDNDLALAYITATVPTDDSVKSQRLREAIIEACDYFNPDNLRFTFTEPNREGFVKPIKSSDFEMMNNWAKDLPRETNLVFESGDSSLKVITEAQEFLNAKRFKGTVSPFLMSLADLEPSIKLPENFICNLSVQTKLGADWTLLTDSEAEIKKRISLIKKLGYAGTWTLDYTDGMGAKVEDIDFVFDNAEVDLNFLVDAWTAK